MENHLETLARKGTVTVVERAGGKATVAVEISDGTIVTLQGGTKAQLLAELCQICKNLPDQAASTPVRK